MNNLSPACSYFTKYWRRAINRGREPLLHNAFNARIVVRELLDEIDVNQLKNRENKDFFQSLINNLIKTDRSVKRRLRPALAEIAQEIQHYHRRPLYLRQLCKGALTQCESLQFFDDNIEELISLTQLAELTEETKREIAQICNNLIVEFLAVGYSEDDVKEFINECFDSVRRDEHGVWWRFPNDVAYPDTPDESALDRYERELRLVEEGLTETDRIKKLGWYARRSTEEYSFIFRCYGIRNRKKALATIDGVTFYSPTEVQFYKPGGDTSINFADEYFDDNAPDAVNAYVSVHAVSTRSAEILARAQVEGAVSVSALSVGGRNRVTLSGSHICLQNGSLEGASYHAFDKPGSNWFNDIEIAAFRDDANSIDRLRQEAASNGWSRRLNEAVFWLRRARESATLAERFLDFWIAIETLCAKSSRSSENWFETKDGVVENAITVIRDVCSRTLALARLRAECYALYRRTQMSWKLQNPRELSERANLRPAEGTTVSIVPFLELWDEIEGHLDDELLRDDGHRISLYIKSAAKAKDTLERYRQEASTEMLFLYRMRNKIAHDGDTRHHMLEILCNLAERYIHVLLSSIRVESESSPGSSLDELLVNSYQRYSSLLKALDEKSANTCALIFRGN
ncbi:hypothetical protein DM40_2536 [Burkholderia cenocepacia]|nr:hypothetical protein DM40_2536 [Burkholderia cenocepacia]